MATLVDWPLPGPLFTAAQVRRMDAQAIAGHGIPGIVLMKRAGQALLAVVQTHWPEVRSLTLVCGKGNNAGDGYVLAGLALNQGMAVQLLQLGAADALSGDAALARDWALAQGVQIEPLPLAAPALNCRGELLVDALLGTGVRGPVADAHAVLIQQINALAAQGLPVLAVDVPSGLCPDTGVPLGVAVQANRTLSFIGAKRGLCTGTGRDFAGVISVADLGVPAAVLDQEAGVTCLHWPALLSWLPNRRPNAHKGDAGHVLIIGGDLGMGGALALAGQAALRVGAGLVSVFTRPAHVAPLLARQPELMVLGADDPLALQPLLAKADVVAIGPGLGTSPWGQALLAAVLSGLGERPMVVDADGLNLLAGQAWRPARPDQVLLTPHPGEAARLLSATDGPLTTAQVQADRFAAATALAQRWQATLILKGAGSLLAWPAQAAGLPELPAAAPALACCMDGNPGMASAGMGDLLTGLAAGLLAQGLPLVPAAALAICLHGAAGDWAAQHLGDRGLSASQLLDFLQPLLNARDEQP